MAFFVIAAKATGGKMRTEPLEAGGGWRGVGNETPPTGLGSLLGLLRSPAP